jgi:molecular chaperone GrpE
MTKETELKDKDIKQEEEKVLNPFEVENKKLIDEIKNLKKEFGDLKDKSVRILADSENTKKRHQAELEKSKKYALFNFANDFVEFVENFHLLKSNQPKVEDSKSVESFLQGLELSFKTLEKTLEKYQIKRISPVEGDEFDHNFHNAISRSETEKDDLNGKIKNLIKSGYVVNDRIISAALVEVYFK